MIQMNYTHAISSIAYSTCVTDNLQKEITNETYFFTRSIDVEYNYSKVILSTRRGQRTLCTGYFNFKLQTRRM